jgi:hypothetical protein
MMYSLNSTEARKHARANMNIFDEVYSIMRAIISASDNGEYETSVSTGTRMTDTNPIIVVTGTVANPTTTGGNTLIIAGNTVTLGTYGTDLDSIIIEINAAGIQGLIAGKDATNHLVLTYTCPSATWNLDIADATANADVGLVVGLISATNPVSVDYYNVWSNLTTDRKIDDELGNIESYFKNLGYTITATTNPITGNTLTWNLYW